MGSTALLQVNSGRCGLTSTPSLFILVRVAVTVTLLTRSCCDAQKRIDQKGLCDTSSLSETTEPHQRQLQIAVVYLGIKYE